MAGNGTTLPPGLTPEMLEKFRNLISMDNEGNWFYAGEPITHERTVQVLHESLRRNEEGRLIVQVGNAWSYVKAEDTPYMVRAVREVGTPPKEFELRLSDGSSERLDLSTLAVGERDVLYCKVKGGKEEARFLRPAYYQLAAHIREAPSGTFVLEDATGRHPIGRRTQKP